MMTADTIAKLDRIFHPRSVAIIGASNREGSFGNTFVSGLIQMGFEGIFPVNPREAEILGIKAYPSIKDIPVRVDLGIILTPPKAVLSALEECVAKGVNGVIIFTAGFGEQGEEGKKIEKEIGKIARQSGIRVVGPNSIGIYSPSAKFLTMPLGLLEKLPAESGPLGVFSQSGSLIDYITWNLSRKGMRFSKTVSCGNEADLNETDYVEYFGQDAETRLIVAYMEGVKDGGKFFQAASRVSAKKPIILWKTGSTAAGAKAAASHTGALAGSAQVWSAMFKQSGIINVSCFEEIVDCATAFYYLPLPKGRRLAILCAMGGTGVGTADNAIKAGLEMARLNDKTRQILREMIPPVGTRADNPVDPGPVIELDPAIHGRIIQVLAADENVDMILVISNKRPGACESIIEAVKTVSKPVTATLLTLPELSEKDYGLMSSNGVATFGEAKRAIFALSKLCDYADFRKSVPAHGL